MPVPRKVSASCGVAAVYIAPFVAEELKTADVERIYEMTDGAYHLIYQNEFV